MVKHSIRNIVLSIFLITPLFLLYSCQYARYIFWNFADVHDLWRFPYLTIEPGESVFYFDERQQPFHPGLPKKYAKPSPCTLEEFLKDHETTCLLVIRNDTILYEHYFEGYTKDSLFPSFSVTKSFVSALVGIAIDEKKIRDTGQNVTGILPWIKDKGFRHITIEQLLNMRSGIRFNEGYSNPFSDAAKFYYGTNLKKYVARLKVKEAPDLHYEYTSANMQVIGFILEAATGETINSYLEDHIWQQIGMEHRATWNLDSRKNGNVKMFCCLNACPRDFAKFGRLYLHNGNWNGKQIVPEAWVKRSTSIINDSRDSENYPFTYTWRVLDGEGAFFAKGVLGQYIFVDRTKNLICLRFGKGYGDIDWADFFAEMATDL